MARNSEVLTRKNHKLEAFLKRNLDADTFEKLRTYDSCIVCSEKEDKQFKYVVITDEWIYLTENPPKRVYETVHFSDIVSVDLVNEFPSFLVGDERENAQHIVVKYLTTEPSKGKKAKKNKSKDKDTLKSSSSSPSLSSARRPSSARALSARNSIAVDRLSYSARQPAKKDSVANILSSRSLPEKRKTVQFGGKDGKFGSHLTVPGQEDSTSTSVSPRDENSAFNPHRSPQVVKKDKQQRSRTKSLDPRTLQQALEFKRGSRTSQTLQTSHTSPTLASNGGISPRHLPKPGPRKSSSDSKLGTAGLFKDYKQTVENGLVEEESEEEEEEDEGNVTIEVPAITVPPLDLKIGGSDGEEDSSSTLASESSLEDIDEAMVGKREADLHLYILHLDSAVYNLTRSAWDNYLIRGTLEEDPRYRFQRDAFAMGKPKGISEKLEQLFCQLRNELLAPHQSLTETFHLISELKAAATRTFAIKKLFWKTSEVLRFMIQTLEKYLPNSPNTWPGQTIEQAKEVRADELELIILIFETLVVMLRETETLSHRMTLLKASKGHLTRELSSLLLCEPKIPSSPNDVSYTDTELDDLLEELINVRTQGLFELFVVTSQGSWGSTSHDNSFFNPCWLVDELDDKPEFEGFLKVLVQQTLNLIAPASSSSGGSSGGRNRHSSGGHSIEIEELSPQKAVLLYTQFFSLHTMLQYSTSVTAFIKKNFYEEFQYYIHAPIVQQRLPANYLLRSWTLRLMEDVVSVILQRKVNLSSRKALLTHRALKASLTM